MGSVRKFFVMKSSRMTGSSSAIHRMNFNVTSSSNNVINSAPMENHKDNLVRAQPEQNKRKFPEDVDLGQGFCRVKLKHCEFN